MDFVLHAQMRHRIGARRADGRAGDGPYQKGFHSSTALRVGPAHYRNFPPRWQYGIPAPRLARPGQAGRMPA
jgi:hypothetical protein